MQYVLDAIDGGASSRELASLPVPESFRGVVVRRDAEAEFQGVPSADKDPRRTLGVEEVATPEAFARDPERVLRFLDTGGGWGDLLAIAMSLPKARFLKAALRWALRRGLGYQIGRPP